MIGFTFIVLVALGAIPLALAIRKAVKGETISTRRWYLSIGVLAGDICCLWLMSFVWNLHGEVLWFTLLDQTARFWRVFWWKSGLSAVSMLGVFVVTCSSLVLAYRKLTQDNPWIPGAVALAISIAAAATATEAWNEILLYLNQVEGSVFDPIFKRNESFYLFSLPVYLMVKNWLMSLLAVVLVSIGLMTAGLYGKRRSETDQQRLGSGMTAEAYAGAKQEALATVHSVIPLSLVLLSLFMFLVAWGYSLEKFELMYSTEGVVTGAGYTDIHARVPAYHAMTWVTVCFGLFILTNAISPSLRRWLARNWKRVAAVPAAWLAITVLVTGLYPYLVYRLKVKPNEITVESPYIQHNIDMTRRAYGLEGRGLEEREFPVSSQLSDEMLDINRDTLDNVRLWDGRALLQILDQTQGIRSYYEFRDVDVDRYRIDGLQRQVMVSVRELDKGQLPPQAQTWVNNHIKYTHGYGAVVNPVNTFLPNGNPELWVKDVPAASSMPALDLDRPQIYYGEMTTDHVYVKTSEEEFDYPLGDDNKWSVYEGKGGVPVSSFWRRLVFSWMFDGNRTLFSKYLNQGSRIMFHRQVQERIELLAPFLDLDGDGYAVIHEGRLVWVWDAYTTSSKYPYSETYDGGINYIRNSVKAVVDAYDGSVSLYVVDETDPIVMTYWKVFPALFKRASDMPQTLREHIRYPEGLFRIQAEMYGTYHMGNIPVFYNREDRWDIATEKYRGHEIPMDPYYVTLQLPGMESPEFLIMVPFTLKGKPRMVGWMAGLCDGENYGKLVAYKFPKGEFITGPLQIESKIDSHEEISQQLTLWDQRGSEVIRGNLLILPLIGNLIVGFEPIYLQAEDTKIPTLVRIVGFHILPGDQRIVWGDTFREAQQVLLGQRGSIADIMQTGMGEGAAKRVFSASELLQAVRQRLELYRRLAGEGSFTEAGEELEQVFRILRQEAE